MTTCKEGKMLWHQEPDFSWKKYTRVIIDPVTANLSLFEKGNAKKVSEEELNELMMEFREILISELGPEYITDKEGKGVLRIKPVITDINVSNPAVNLFTAAAILVPLDTGGASIQVEFFNSATGERAALMAERKKGTPIQMIGGFSKFGHAKSAFKEWGRELKKALEEGNE